MAGAWKVAYADFVTAMMALFLLLWILSTADPQTKAGLAAYFAGERNFDSNVTSPISNNPFVQNTDKIDMRKVEVSELEKTHYVIAQKLKQLLMADAIPQMATGVTADDIGVQLRVNSDVMFKKGTATLSPEGTAIMEEVSIILHEYNLYLVVRGHASPDEVIPPYPSTWEISGARSAAALQYLAQHSDIKPTRMRGVLYGDTRPIKPNLSAESRAINRRVEFFFHRPEVMSYSVVY